MARGPASSVCVLKTLLLISSAGLLTSLCSRINAQRGINSRVDLHRRGLPSGFFSKLASPSGSSSSNSSTVNTAAANNTGCTQPDINPSTWISLGIDNYLSNLPNGTTKSLHEYALSVNSMNFVCGIGEDCQAGQLCSPVTSPGWEVLVAAQEWNRYQNKLYDAVGTAIQLVTAVSSALVTDLYPPSHSGDLWDLMKSFVLASGITITIFTALEIGMLIFGGSAFASIVALMALGATAVTMGGAGGVGTKLALMHPEETPFERWSRYAFYLSEWQQHVQKRVANEARTVINAGISSPKGLANIVKNGVFFREVPQFSEADLISGLKNTTTARIAVDILRTQGAFVTIASDKCTGKGPGGAWEGNDKLSYCSKNGTMMNIIHGYKKKVKNTWFNAQLLEKKYGITVQYLAEQSFHCQQNHKSFGFDPYKSGTFPSSLDAECIGNLPVCDFRIQELAEAKSEKGTMRACRSVGRLPI
ncbi:hypothetical protein BY996DRAFT_4581795 [Phakopsora pachyrhizi]|uniref:DUF7872 domain-containing protein n=1 Tax=Phakopsora pachyrhizi TaxID=170000 RepID=A0AAV0BNZ5_PHAPC|nr:hypothetical protein BY996DRAFT_4581795 [Phakopsora pachyrhizi]CAH7673141.1 hypothetical protein PPACK8108_LOCUS8009 [Phakopsora pachyrhizi]CAH7688369.1 hypothetical protein PPACK8108_LOCUS23326 [Phakopsora pachyrhizi]